MLPLASVRVIAVEQYGAGPFGTMFLADLGAEVIKIENPTDGGDISRDVGPYYFEDRDSYFFHSLNRNKKSFTLDLSKAGAHKVFHDLVRSADAVCSNLRGDVPQKLGLTYQDLNTVNGAIVCAHLSAYGRDGPRADWPGYDYLMQAEAGYLSLTGEPGSPPARFGLSVVDFMTGLGLAYAILAGLTGVRSTGLGQDMDVSLFDFALANTNYLAAWYLNKGSAQERLPRSAHPSLVPCQLYQTADGWLFIMCNKEKFWSALCDAIDRPEWKEDARFSSFKERLTQRDYLTQLIDEALSSQTTQKWLEKLSGVIPVAPVNDIAQALENPFVREYGRLQTLTHPTKGDYQLIANPVHAGAGEPPSKPAPQLGEHTDALLEDLGYSETCIQGLRSDGII